MANQLVGAPAPVRLEDIRPLDEFGWPDEQDKVRVTFDAVELALDLPPWTISKAETEAQTGDARAEIPAERVQSIEAHRWLGPSGERLFVSCPRPSRGERIESVGTF